jgi:hypothetical protein
MQNGKIFFLNNSFFLNQRLDESIQEWKQQFTIFSAFEAAKLKCP